VIEALDARAHGQPFFGNPVLDGAHDLGLVLINDQIAWDPVAFRHVAIAVRRLTTEIVASTDLLEAPPAKAFLEQRAFVLGHRPLNLEEELIVGIIRERMLQKDDFTAHPAKLFEPQHLISILTGQPIRTPDGHQRNGAVWGGIAQPLQRGAVEAGPTIAFIAVNMFRLQVMAVGARPRPQSAQLTGDGLLPLLAAGGYTGIQSNRPKVLLSEMREYGETEISYSDLSTSDLPEGQRSPAT
jgi:hypothetical protein